MARHARGDGLLRADRTSGIAPQTKLCERCVERIEQQQALVDLVLRGTEDVDGVSTRGVNSMFDASMLRVLSEAQIQRDRRS